MNTLGDPFVFWSLRLYLFAILIFCGKKVTKSNALNFSRYLWLAVISFALVEGLRWMRGTDYENYYQGLMHGGIYIRDNFEPLYKAFVVAYSSLRFDPVFAFVAFSGLLMASIGLTFKSYKEAALWGFPLVLLLLGYSAENLVRQYIAVSFLALSFYYYTIDKKKQMFIVLAVVPFFHISGILGVIGFLILTAIDKLRLPPLWIFISIYIFLQLVWNPEWLTSFAFFMGSLNVDSESSMAVYINHADQHFTSEGSLSLRYGLSTNRSIVNIMTYFITDLVTVIVGYFACLKDNKLHFVYYFVFIGIVIKIMTSDIELLLRMGYWFSWMEPLLIGLITSFKNYGKYKHLRMIVMSILFIRYVFYGVIRNIGYITMEEGCMFIWDK